MTRDAEEAETPRERRRRGSGDAETRRDAEDRVASPLQRGALAGTWAFSLAVRTDDVQPGPPAKTPGVPPRAQAATCDSGVWAGRRGCTPSVPPARTKYPNRTSRRSAHSDAPLLLQYRRQLEQRHIQREQQCRDHQPHSHQEYRLDQRHESRQRGVNLLVEEIREARQHFLQRAGL